MWEWYETPEELTASGIEWGRVLDRWDLLDYCFARYLHVDLTDALHTRTWAWFVRKVSGLLSDDTLIAHHFRNTKPTEGT